MALVAACGSPGPSLTALQRTIKVVLVSVFSGQQAAEGANEQNSLQVEVDALNAGGGLLGQRVEIVAADGELNAAKTAALVGQQLSDGDVGLLVGPASAAAFAAVKQDVEAAALPNCPLAATEDLTGGSRFSFRPDPSDRSRVGALLDAVHRARPSLQKIALLDEGDAVGRSADALLSAQAASRGLRYVGHVVVPPGADPHGPVAQMVGQGAQALVLSQAPADAAQTAAAVAQLPAEGRPALLGFDRLGAYDFASLAGDAAVGATFAATNLSYLSDIPQARWSSGYRAFVGTVTRQYGYATNGVEMRGMPAVADCVLQWSRAVQKAGTFRGPAVANAWATLDLAAADTDLGVHERLAADDRSMVPADGVFVYSWAKQGSAYRLRQLAGPS